MILNINIVLMISVYIGSMFFFTKKKEASEPQKTVETMDASMICKFVVDGSGKKIGESVSIDHDVLIIKSGSLFLGVPLKHVEFGEKTLLVKGIFDFTKAYELGEKWRKGSFREMKKHEPFEEKAKRF
ncbi:MAG: hypothetical protein JXA75_04745 [Candidatus Thermoplasmatota archaeon]|nr:hypothetical protein [Candidatus Thermoplasmatota archaeon]